MAFKSFEPSEAMIRAMQARVKSKAENGAAEDGGAAGGSDWSKAPPKLRISVSVPVAAAGVGTSSSSSMAPQMPLSEAGADYLVSRHMASASRVHVPNIEPMFKMTEPGGGGAAQLSGYAASSRGPEMAFAVDDDAATRPAYPETSGSSRGPAAASGGYVAEPAARSKAGPPARSGGPAGDLRSRSNTGPPTPSGSASGDAKAKSRAGPSAKPPSGGAAAKAGSTSSRQLQGPASLPSPSGYAAAAPQRSAVGKPPPVPSPSAAAQGAAQSAAGPYGGAGFSGRRASAGAGSASGSGPWEAPGHAADGGPPRPASGSAGSSHRPPASGPGGPDSPASGLASPARTTGNSEMQRVADVAMAKALAALGPLPGPSPDASGAGSARQSVLNSARPSVLNSARPSYLGEDSAYGNYVSKVPSAVTVGGAPVACDGDLVYLGAGLYASVAPQPKPVPKAPPKKQPPRGRGPLGPRSSSVFRSASAHLVGPQSAAGYADGMSRAQSEGQLGLGRLEEEGDGATLDSGRGPGAAGPPPGPKAWRPGGVARRPPPAAAHSLGSARRREESEDGGSQAGFDSRVPSNGDHSEMRAREREAKMREAREANLFGKMGVFSQLAGRGEDAPRPGPRSASNGGLPCYGEQRAAERRAAKEERIQRLLEEREVRLATEAAERQAAKERGLAAALAPGPRLVNGRSYAGGSDMAAHEHMMATGALEAQAAEELEKQKLRVACKMEILDFFNGYSSAVGKMSAEQTALLLGKLNGGHNNSRHVDEEEEREERILEWAEKVGSQHGSQVPTPAHRADHQGSVHERLQQVSDLCNQAFDDDLDL